MMWFFCFGIVRNGIMLGVKGDSFSFFFFERSCLAKQNGQTKGTHTHTPLINTHEKSKLEFWGKNLSPILDLFKPCKVFVFILQIPCTFPYALSLMKKQTQLFFIKIREKWDGIKFNVNDGGFTQCLHHVYNNSGQNIYVYPHKKKIYEWKRIKRN